MSEYYEIAYGPRGGGFYLSSEIVKEAFIRFPPDSDEGKTLWHPEGPPENLIREEEMPDPAWDTCNILIDTVPIGDKGYMRCIIQFAQKLDYLVDSDNFHISTPKDVQYVTRDFKTFYYLSRIPSESGWRQNPHVIALYREKGFVLSDDKATIDDSGWKHYKIPDDPDDWSIEDNERQYDKCAFSGINQSGIAIAKIPVGYTYLITKSEGTFGCANVESVTPVFPYKQVIRELVAAIKTDSSALSPLAQKLIDNEIDIDSI